MSTPPDRFLDAATLLGAACGVAARSELWRPHVRASARLRHCHALVRKPHLSVWVICWMPGHDTGFHDHDGVAGAVAVVTGRVAEARLRLGGAPAYCERGAGEAFSFGPYDIHRVTHLAGEPAVTIHAYSPELRRMGAYEVAGDGTLLRRTLEEDTELRAPEEVAA